MQYHCTPGAPFSPVHCPPPGRDLRPSRSHAHLARVQNDLALPRPRFFHPVESQVGVPPVARRHPAAPVSRCFLLPLSSALPPPEGAGTDTFFGLEKSTDGCCSVHRTMCSTPCTHSGSANWRANRSGAPRRSVGGRVKPQPTRVTLTTATTTTTKTIIRQA